MTYECKRFALATFHISEVRWDEIRLSVPCGTNAPCRANESVVWEMFFLLCTTACAFSATSSLSTSAPRQERAHRLRLSADEINPGAVAGTNLRILEYPHPLLRAPNADVTEFDDELKNVKDEDLPKTFVDRFARKAAGG